MPSNKVFIATSLDGYIAKTNGDIEWLHSVPNPDGNDMGYAELMNNTDAIIMGKNTFNTVIGFDMEWPYNKPVFVLSNTLKEIPIKAQNKAEIVSGDLKQLIKKLHHKGFYNLYIDGGKTIQSFLKEDLIDEMTITIIPVLLGDGIPLFGKNNTSLKFKYIKTERYLNTIVQNTFVRDPSSSNNKH
jgi:dihydrofolate reductase